MHRNVAKQAQYQKKYMKRKKMLSVLLDPKDDKDIIKWLGRQENRSEAVRRAIRADIVYQEIHKA
jgi:Arc/MetJ-type ribon-helix-helix transcriptional regulator